MQVSLYVQELLLYHQNLVKILNLNFMQTLNLEQQASILGGGDVISGICHGVQAGSLTAFAVRRIFLSSVKAAIGGPIGMALLAVDIACLGYDLYTNW